MPRKKKRKDNMKTKRDKEECTDNQQNAQNKGFCCHHHAKRMKLKDLVERQMAIQAKVDGPGHCIGCDEDPYIFVQIELRLYENDTIYYDEDKYANNLVAYNSGRGKRAYQYAAFVLWERYQQP
jgi:hypothetical protein